MNTVDRSPFGALLRSHRVAAGWSQERLAEAAGLSLRAVSDLERGARRMPRLETVRMLADALKLDDRDRVNLFRAARSKADGDPGRMSVAVFTPPPARLPTPLTPLVGRQRELDTILSLFRDAVPRLVTLTGPGGVGKTRLAQELAQRLEPEFADGVRYVPLASLASAGLVVPAIAEALGVREAAGGGLPHALEQFFRSKHLLVILDNFEHLLAAAPLVADLMAASPRLAVLATSRIPLRLRGELQISISPLGVPPADRPLSLAEATESGAMQLFVSRARAVLPDFALEQENLGTIAEICRRLDGLPLALELASVRINVLTPHALLSRLERRLPLLTEGARDLPARQQTLEATIAWSYQLLSGDQQRLLRLVSVFAGGFTLEAAEWIITHVMGNAMDAVDGLAALVDASLVRFEAVNGNAPRYTMLESIREFGCDRLASSGEEPSVRDQHAQWCLSLARTDASRFDPTQHRERIKRLGQEYANLRAALDWLDRTDRSGELAELVANLKWFWYLGAPSREGVGWCERVLAKQHRHPPSLRFELSSAAGILAHAIGSDVASQYLDRALTIARRSGNTQELAEATCQLAIVSEDAGRYLDAEAGFREAGRLYGQVEDRWNQAVCDYHLGIVAYGRGDLTGARRRLELAAATAEGMGDVLVPVWCRNYCILIAAELGERDQAASLFRETWSMIGPVHDHDRSVYIATGAVVASIWRQPNLAARLFGAASAGRQGRSFEMPERDVIVRNLEQARRQLGDTVFETEWRQGYHRMRNEIDADIDLVRFPQGEREYTEVPSPHGPAAFDLSHREQEVLRLMADGMTNRDIADTLFISVRTVATHIDHILTKLDARSRTAAVAYAIRSGLA